MMCYSNNYTCSYMFRLCLNYSDPFRPTNFHPTHIDQFTEITYGHQTLRFLMCYSNNYTCSYMSRLCLNYSDPLQPKKCHPTHIDQFTETTYRHQTLPFSDVLLHNYTCFDMLPVCFLIILTHSDPKNFIPPISNNLRK